MIPKMLASAAPIYADATPASRHVASVASEARSVLKRKTQTLSTPQTQLEQRFDNSPCPQTDSP